MLTIYYKDKNTRDLEHRGERNFRPGTWIHVEDPTAEDLARLSAEAKLDEGMLSDATDPNEVPRVQKEDGVTYFFARVPYMNNGVIYTTAITIIITNDYVVTISKKPHRVWDNFFSTRLSFSTPQRTKLFFMIMREVNREYQRYLASISKQVRQSSGRIEKISNDDIEQFVKFEISLNDFLSSLIPMNSALESTLSGKFFELSGEDDELIEDLSLSNEQLAKQCLSDLKLIVNIREAYSTIVTNKLNQSIRLLTSLTIVLTVPMMFASFLGMNIVLPFSTTSGHVFWVVVGVSVVISVALMRGLGKR